MDFLLYRNPSCTFSYVRRHRNNCTSQLAAKSKLLILREFGYKPIDGNHQFFSFLPCC